MSVQNSGSSSAPDRQAQIDQEKAQIAEDFKMNMQMNSLQRQASQNNTFVTALSTLEKGKDDVLRAIANNLK